ncbi:hypothetical protein LINGRAHAP2_LOCUS30049 [Linum grandiflorum]
MNSIETLFIGTIFLLIY